ncbi:amidohydrolase family protein [Saccharopolyspora sp. NPDC050642]|uniref:amidohydrolase family protein n=1 Tax=Saccharopolyspora sp. NPDC050642 TaxID=3157099 RepID=UPI0033E6BA66
MTKLISGATVVPVDAERSVIRDGAVVVADDGRIADVGKRAVLEEAHPDAERIDARGQLLLPGFVNLHVHCALAVTRGIGDDMGGAPVYRKDIPQGVILGPDDTYVFSRLGALQALAFGSTTIVENYIHSLSNVKALAELGIRAVVSERVHDADLFTVRGGEYSYDADLGKRLLETNAQLIEEWHGYDGGRITCQVGPHGPDTASSRLLEQAALLAEERGVGMFMHLAQTAGEVEQVRRLTGRSSVQHLGDLGILGSGLIAGHCAFLEDGDAELLAESGTNVCHIPVVNAKSGWIAPAARLRRLGAVVGLATDNMVHDMVEAMRFALCVNRVADGGPTGIKAMDVLEMATIQGARAIGREADLGSIEPGKLADLVFVDLERPHLAPLLDPVANLVYAGQSSDIHSVMVNGEFVVRDRAVLTVDTGEVVAAAQERAEDLWRSVAGWEPADRAVCGQC